MSSRAKKPGAVPSALAAADEHAREHARRHIAVDEIEDEQSGIFEAPFAADAPLAAPTPVVRDDARLISALPAMAACRCEVPIVAVTRRGRRGLVTCSRCWGHAAREAG